MWTWLTKNQLRLVLVLPVCLVAADLMVIAVLSPDPEDQQRYLLSLRLLAAWQALNLARLALVVYLRRRRVQAEPYPLPHG